MMCTHVREVCPYVSVSLTVHTQRREGGVRLRQLLPLSREVRCAGNGGGGASSLHWRGRPGRTFLLPPQSERISGGAVGLEEEAPTYLSVRAA